MASAPIYSPSSLLPGSAGFTIPVDCANLDISGLPGEAMGGITFTCHFAFAANSTGQRAYVVACPNDLEVNQTSTGDESFGRLVIASFANGAAADEVQATWTLPRTKTGANRTGSSVAVLHSGATKNVTWTWADTSTVINAFRVKVILADGTLVIANSFVRIIPSGGLANYTWNSLGNP